MMLAALALVISCDEKGASEAAEQDAGTKFERIAPTPGDVKKANQNLKRIKKNVQKAADERGDRIEDSANPE